jgi:ABC-2 type transport system ATP-binding protein
MRVREMLLFQGRLHGMSRAKLRTALPAVLDRVGVRDRERQLVGTLSRGLRQRVGLAVALLPEPEVLILDEPTSGLDPLQRLEVRKLLGELAAEHTVLLSSHILPEIEAVAPRVSILDRGRMAADGTPAELVRQLGRAAHVRFEAVVGPGAAAAARLLGALPGVGEVRDLGRLGIHHVFELACEEDLREDVGALAAAKGWALRELSYHAPTLEQLFARLAVGTSLEELGEGEVAGAPATPAPAQAQVELSVELGVASSPPPLGTPGQPKKGAYNLNPFRAAPPPESGGGGAGSGS